jgi:hypothetical protein
MRVARVVAVALAVATVAGCGSAPSVLLKTHGSVIGIGLDGERLAWARLEGDCVPHLYLREDGTDRALSVPRRVSRLSECFTNAHLVLAGSNVGWVLLDQGGNSSSFVAGASSWKPARSVTFARVIYAIDPPVVGTTFGGLAADGDHVLWGWAHVPFRDTQGDGFCDVATTDPGCQTRTAGGGIKTWSGGSAGTLPRIPPVASLVGADGWVAIVPEPRTGWIDGGPRLGQIRAVRLSDRTTAKVRRSGFEGPVAVSSTMLAVDRLNGGFELYALPGGEPLRRVKVRNWVYPMVFCAGTTFVVETDDQQLLFVEAKTGRRTVVTVADPARDAITAIAVDGSRVAWAESDWKSRTSVIRVRSVS